MPPLFELWLDTNLSPIVAKWLQDEYGYRCKSAFSLKLYGLPDLEIFQKSKDACISIIILSKDVDLIEIVKQRAGYPKLIHIKTGNIDNRVLYECLLLEIQHALRLLLQ